MLTCASRSFTGITPVSWAALAAVAQAPIGDDVADRPLRRRRKEPAVCELPIGYFDEALARQRALNDRLNTKFPVTPPASSRRDGWWRLCQRVASYFRPVTPP